MSSQANRTKNYTFLTQSILEFLSQEWLEERQPEPELWRPHPSLCFPHTDPTKRKSVRSRWSHPSNRPNILFTIFSLTCFSVKIIKWAVYSSIIIYFRVTLQCHPSICEWCFRIQSSETTGRKSIFVFPALLYQIQPLPFFTWIFKHTGYLLGFQNHHNKWLQRAKIYSLPDFVVGNLQSGCQWGHTPSRDPRGGSFLTSSSSGGSRLSLGYSLCRHHPMAFSSVSVRLKPPALFFS